MFTHLRVNLVQAGEPSDPLPRFDEERLQLVLDLCEHQELRDSSERKSLVKIV